MRIILLALILLSACDESKSKQKSKDHVENRAIEIKKNINNEFILESSASSFEATDARSFTQKISLRSKEELLKLEKIRIELPAHIQEQNPTYFFTSRKKQKAGSDIEKMDPITDEHYQDHHLLIDVRNVIADIKKHDEEHHHHGHDCCHDNIGNIVTYLLNDQSQVIATFIITFQKAEK